MGDRTPFRRSGRTEVSMADVSGPRDLRRLGRRFALGLGLGVGFWLSAGLGLSPKLVNSPVVGAGGPTESPKAPRGDNPRRTQTVDVVERAGAAVVSLITERVLDPVQKPVFQTPGSVPARENRSTVLGSGLIISSDGYVVTNHHVVARGSRIVIRLGDGTEYPGELVHWDKLSDVALLRIRDRLPGPLPSLALGRSDDLLVGEPAIALGNPFGLGITVTTGVVSATRRPFFESGRLLHRELIQTDAPINPGNSGGPLLNALGEVIGINAGLIAQGQGLGFAIPSDRVRDILTGLLDFRTERMIHLGIPSDQLETVSKESAPSGTGTRPRAASFGVRIGSLTAGGPAEVGGLRSGDIVRQIEDREIADLFDFNFALYRRRVGEQVWFSVLRGGRSLRVRVTLGRNEDITWRRLGILARDVTEDLGARLELEPDRWYGVYVLEVDPEGPAAQVMVRPGDLIWVLGDYQINGLESLRSHLTDRFPEDELVALFLWRSETNNQLQGSIRLRP